MSYSEVLKVSDDGKFRVKLIQDDDAPEPYDDGQSPLIRLEYGGYGWRAEHVMATGRPTYTDYRIETAACRWGSELDKFGKYLRAFYGTTEIKVDTSTTRGVTYITYDTAEWRKHVGAPPESADMDEYLAWCVGDCWGYVVEKNVTWQNVDDANDRMETWEEVFDYSCWGYYGDTEYFRNSALEALESAATS